MLERGTAPSYRLTISGAAHLTFTDGPLYLPPVPSIVGSLGRTESPRVVAAATDRNGHPTGGPLGEGALVNVGNPR